MAGTVVRREAAAEQNPAYRGTVFVFFLFPMYWGKFLSTNQAYYE